MELKYKIDRHSPSHIMPIMLLSFLQHIISLCSLCVSQFHWFGLSFFALSLSILVLFGLSISKESNRKNESRCVVVHFFPLRADCFLPLVQRDLWRICWLERFRAKSDSYLISILYCCYYLSSSSNFCMASTWATYAQAHICVGLYQYKGFYLHIRTRQNQKPDNYDSWHRSVLCNFDCRDITEINNSQKELFLFTNDIDYSWSWKFHWCTVEKRKNIKF